MNEWMNEWFNIRKHFKTPRFLKHNVYYKGALTEGQQTSDNFHRPMLRHKKPTPLMKNS